MRYFPLILCATLLLVRPEPTRAATPGLTVPAVVVAGQGLDLHWEGLPGPAHEVELELSLDGGRWVRISPELEADEGHYLWGVPAVSSARARLRLRAGGEGFEAEVTASAEFRIDLPATACASPARALDWWQVGEHTPVPGWGHDRRAATLSGDHPISVAEPDRRTQHAVPAAVSSPVAIDPQLTNRVACTVNARPTASRQLPLRL